MDLTTSTKDSRGGILRPAWTETYHVSTKHQDLVDLQANLGRHAKEI
jgi:hypothetical protein